MTKRSNIIFKKEEEDVEVLEGEIIYDDNNESPVELKKETGIQPFSFFKTIGKIGSLFLMALEAGSFLNDLNKNKTKNKRRRERRKNENISTGKRRQRNRV
ncbi:MAG: hypothetical protein ABFR75_05450 [Acidobacteriota bacterium]